MKEKFKRRKKETDKRLIIVILLATIVTFVVISQHFLYLFYKRHAGKDLSVFAASQTELLESHLSSEFAALKSFAYYMEAGVDFQSPQNRESLANYVSHNQLCMFAYVDIEGNATSYLGEKMGNVSDRTYFSEVISGRSTEELTYLEKPKGADSPRVILSVPVYKNGTINGVLFESKEIEIFESAIFPQLSKMNADIIIYDRLNDSVIIHRNLYDNSSKTAIDFLSEENVISELLAENENDFSNEINLKIDNSTIFCSYRPLLHTNAWYLICLTDSDIAVDVYDGDLQDIAYFVYLVIGAFAVVCGYCISLLKKRIKENQNQKTEYDFQLNTYQELLELMDSTVVTYDIENDVLTCGDSFERVFRGQKIEGKLDDLKTLETEHKEFSFDELYTEMKMIEATKRPSSFDTIVYLDDGSTIWIKIALLPICTANGSVSHIIAAVQDATEQHGSFDTAVHMVNEVPGGLHRCYLSDPIHLEYASPGLLAMMGYTEEEFNEIIGPDKNYCNCIAEEDIPAFDEFCANLAKAGGTANCEYRLLTKNGDTIYVVDTMDARRAASGVMYGYSVVTDMSGYYRKEQEIAKQLQEANKALEQARIRISTSQMQPHFLYNALASIREIILDDPDYASDLICDFTTHLRSCIRSMSSDNQIPFMQELDNIKAYVNIEKMRFGDRLRVEYDIRIHDFTIIPLSIQPLVENAIRHGVYERGAKGGLVVIRTTKSEDNDIVISVEDNGVGFDYENIKREIAEGKRDSTGLTNLIFRFRELMNAEVTIDSMIGEGSCVKVIIPEEVLK